MPRTSRLALALGLLVATPLALPGVAAYAAPPASGTQTCRLVTEDLQATTTADAEPQQRFEEYGDTSGQWVGADSTYSVPLRDGRIAWLFSDTLYGEVSDGTLSPTESKFLNNSILLDDGRTLRTVTGGTEADPDSLVPGTATSWSWFGAGTRQPNGNLQVVLLRFEKFGPDLFDFRWTSNGVATIDTRTWQVTSVQDLPSSAGIQWGSWLQRGKGETLVYGVEDLGASKYMHLARVRGNDLAKQSHWEYWTGTGWSDDEADSARLMDGVANEYSVTPYRDGYLLVTHDSHEPLSSRVLAYRSCSPTGPFVAPIELYRTPETGATGSYGDPNIFTYNAHEHPELRNGDTLLVSYNVNSFDNTQIYRDVTIYRPRFVSVTLSSR